MFQVLFFEDAENHPPEKPQRIRSAEDDAGRGKRRHPPPHLRIVQRLERPFLHAAKLVFTHPRDGRRVTVQSELPPDLLTFVEELRAQHHKSKAKR